MKRADHSMKVNYEKAIEVNNEFKLNVDELQDDIKHLKEQSDIDNEDEEHNDLWRNYCGIIFRNGKEGDNHMDEACE